MKAPDYAITKLMPPGSELPEYPNHKRAGQVYNAWMSGYTEEEISEFYDLPEEEVIKDIMHIKITLPVHTLIQHQNNRNRILLQIQESESFRRLIRESLTTHALDYLTAGVSPASVLKEFREATGLTQKPEPLLQINSQTNIVNTSGNNKSVVSAEDVIRMALASMQLPEHASEEEVIDVEEEGTISDAIDEELPTGLGEE